MSLRKALLAATMLSLPTAAAHAQFFAPTPGAVNGLYIAGGGGVNFLQGTANDADRDADAQVRALGLRDRQVKVEFETGFGFVASLGYGFGNGVRAEIEGNYRQNDVDDVRAFGTPLGNVGGTVRSYGVMGNALFDIVLPAFVPTFGLQYVPYLGVGAGYVWHDYDDVRADFGPAGNRQRIRINDEDGNFAYQAIVGAAFQAPYIAPGVALTLEYRFLGTLSPELDTTIAPVGAVAPPRGKIEVDNFNHSVFVGLRYAFNQPAPAAVVVPPAPVQREVARTYLVFFDWDRADLTDRARQIIGEAANNSRAVRSTRIEVAGHADRSGTPQYNQRLSQRRADNVAAELVRQGVSRNDIVVTAFGESRPLVPTADGVREPQNRRVEIVLR